MTDHTWGVDKSHYDSAGGTGEIVKEGFGFLTHKAGGDSNDNELAAWWSDAKPQRANILLGAYWVLYPGHGAGAGDAFLARLDSQCPGWRDGPFILQLDCEEWNGDTGTMPKLADIRACANRLRVLAPKLEPIVYAPHWAYGDTLKGLGCPLWSSSYTTAKGAASAIYPGDGYSGWAEYSGIVPSIAQFSSTATVAGDTTTDVNVFKGTLAQLTALLAPGWSADMAASLNKDDVAVIMNTDNVLTSPPGSKNADGTDNLYWAFASYVKNTYAAAVSARTYANDALTAANTATAAVNALAVKVAALSNPSVDPVGLAAALAPALAPLINHDDQATLEAALLAAIQDIVGKSQSAGGQAPALSAPRFGGDTPIHDEAADALTKQARQDRQPGIQGS